MTQTPNSKLTKLILQKNNIQLEKQLLKHMISKSEQNCCIKFSFKLPILVLKKYSFSIRFILRSRHFIVLLVTLFFQTQLRYQTKHGFYSHKKQSDRRFLSQLDEQEQDGIFGNIASDRQENTVVSESTGDRDFTVGTSDDNLMTNENIAIVKPLERCFIERIAREMSNIVDTVEDRIQNANLTTSGSIVAPTNDQISN